MVSCRGRAASRFFPSPLPACMVRRGGADCRQVAAGARQSGVCSSCRGDRPAGWDDPTGREGGGRAAAGAAAAGGGHRGAAESPAALRARALPRCEGQRGRGAAALRCLLARRRSRPEKRAGRGSPAAGDSASSRRVWHGGWRAPRPEPIGPEPAAQLSPRHGHTQEPDLRA